MIAEGEMNDFAQKLSGKFYDNLINLYKIMIKYKEDIQDGDSKDISNKMLKIKLLPSIHSYLQISSSLKEIIDNPYSFILKSDNKGMMSFHNLHPKYSSDRATKGFHSRIFTSATISPQKDIALVLGLEDVLMARIDPVFDDKNYEVFMVGGINSSAKEELKETNKCFGKNENKVLEDLFEHAIDSARGKNIGIFCSSNRAVEEIHGLLNNIKPRYNAKLLTYIAKNGKPDKDEPEICDDYKDICQILGYENQNLNNHNAENVIKAFMDMGSKKDITTMLLGVAGGKLAEGIDYNGDKMEMVVTVGLPYPSSAAEQRINLVKKDYFYMLKGDRQLGEDLAYKQDAFRKLAQSIGRAHRSKSDRAVIICADEMLMGIKNVKDGDYSSDRYEYLSLYNAKENLKLLQKPLSQIKENIVFSGHDAIGEQELKKYISKSGFCTLNDFISLDKMSSKIKKFYRGSGKK
ncbi:MAG: helicase C-terminal domain-containing protein [Nanoarchaeota archaeon]|nr:helicase C-terminal domain-containing protein [Nanoarchaeota archaeon]